MDGLVEIPANSKINFTNKSQFNHLLYSGWFPPESWGTWSNGKKASILLSVAPGTDGLYVRGKIFTPNDRPQRIGISVNGLLVGNMNLINSGLNLKIYFTPELKEEINAGKLLDIELDLPDAISPKNLMISDDTRDLSFGIREIQTFSLEKEPSSTVEVSPE